MSRLVRTAPDLLAAYEQIGGRVAADRRHRAVVMTMGALHDGHVALMEAARHVVGADGAVVVTVFVNPRQFLPGEDLERYPRTLEADLDVCREHDVDLVFAPDVDVVYDGTVETIEAGALGSLLEGAIRPGHFTGVLTVVRRLLDLTDAGIAVFGEKDYQQLVLVRDMVQRLDLPVTVVSVPTVREQDGLAMSSRNRYLSGQERASATALSRALLTGASVAGEGSEAVVAAAMETLASAGVEPDYVAVTDPMLGAPHRGEARLLVAARIGQTRLIDNTAISLGAA